MRYLLMTKDGTVVEDCNTRVMAESYVTWYGKKGIELTIKLA